MIKLSVCVETIFREFPFIERIIKVAELGLPAFEFWNWRNKDIPVMQRVKEECGLKISAFCIEPSGNLVNLEDKDKFIHALKESIEVAHKLNCQRLIVTTGNQLSNIPRDIQYRNIIENLANAAKIAEKENIILLLEPLNTLVDHPGYFLSSSREGFNIINEVASPNVRLLYDVYHQQITEGNLISTIERNIEKIGHFHIADVPGRHEPGTGEINYTNILKKIDELGYNGFIGLEYYPLNGSEKSLKYIIEEVLPVRLERKKEN